MPKGTLEMLLMNRNGGPRSFLPRGVKNFANRRFSESPMQIVAIPSTSDVSPLIVSAISSPPTVPAYPDAVVDLDDRAKKIEAYYGPMSYAGYPVMYAMLLDMARGATLSPESNTEFFESNFGTTSETGQNQVLLDFKNLVISNISGVLDTPWHATFSLRFEFSGKETFFCYNAATEEDQQAFMTGHKVLLDALEPIFQPNSLTSQVVHALSRAHPEINAAFSARLVERVVVDGIISTYEAAANLSPSHDGQSIKGRMLQVLNSDLPEDITKLVKLATLTLMGGLGFVPTNEIIEGEQGLQLHPDMHSFVKMINKVTEGDAPPIPLLCPFAVPLGDYAETAIQYYGGESTLPSEVVTLIREQALTSGIRTSSDAIATLLTNKGFFI